MFFDLSGYSIVDVSSGTCFDGSEALVLDVQTRTSDELEVFNEGSDSDRTILARKYGLDLEQHFLPEPDKYDSAVQALDRIQALLSDNEWNSDVFESVAEAIRDTGRPIEDVE